MPIDTATSIFSQKQIWTAWNSGSSCVTGTVSSITGTADVIWRGWCDNSTSTSATITLTPNQIWAGWNVGIPATISPYQYQLPAAETPEQVQARLARQETYRQNQIQIECEKAKARERAEKLLFECLSEKQQTELRANGYFHLETIAANGERRKYRINRGRSRNVQQVSDEGRVIKTLCMHPIEAVPDADTMLAQKFYLESCEDEFLRIANHS